MVSSMVVPSPGAENTFNRPPTSSARSRMPDTPRRPPEPFLAAKPQPSSRTRSVVRPTLELDAHGAGPRVLDDVGQRLLRHAVQHELLFVGELGRLAVAVKVVRMPVRSPKFDDLSRKCAGTRPWSSSAVGRSVRASVSSSSIAWVARVWISLSSERSPGGTSSAAAWSRSRIAVSAWLTSSCRSWAIRARSSSCARMTARPPSMRSCSIRVEQLVEAGGEALDLVRRVPWRVGALAGRGGIDAFDGVEQRLERHEPALEEQRVEEHGGHDGQAHEQVALHVGETARLVGREHRGDQGGHRDEAVLTARTCARRTEYALRLLIGNLRTGSIPHVDLRGYPL